MTVGPPLLPEGFCFGTSTAAYQIEGAIAEQGRGRSIWDTFCEEPGRIADGSTGEIACDHFHRMPEDVALLQRLGAQGYRFSIAWPRIQPDGSGPANQAGLGFYDRLVDELLEAGVSPMATLYHWDLPQALQDRYGGWLSRDTAHRFAEYAAIVGARLADRVAWWCPVNEPNVVTMLGYALGEFAPGEALMMDALPVAHHLLLGHGLATTALRTTGATAVGTATNHVPVRAAGDAQADHDAAGLFDVLWNRLFADPILLGRYPDGFGELMPVPNGSDLDDDLSRIRQPLDFYGLNYYNPIRVGAAAEGSGLPFDYEEALPGYPTTDFGWPVVPEGLRELLVLMQDRYPGLPPIIVTENGCSYGMGPGPDGVVDDQPRIDYLDAHLRAVADAIADGVDVTGYFCWSLLDNFEWTDGYRQRFGLVHVDYDTLERTPKRSFDWYAEVVRANRRVTGAARA